jgi:hypothetical protein
MNTSQINTAIVTGIWTNQELNSITDAVKFARARLVTKMKFQVRTGTVVEFTSTKTGITLQGTVTKMAQKYATVQATSGLWRVPANMLTIVA